MIHQLVHGYRRGHELLAGSVALSEADAELTTRLSDLSGSLSPNVPFTPYLNLYPLPSGRFYGVSKTWLDESAPRAGCVLTHTLLIPAEQWSAVSIPRRFSELLTKPEISKLDTVRLPVKYSTTDGPFTSVADNVADESRARLIEITHQRQPLRLDWGTAMAFTDRFFGEGVRPVVLLGISNTEEVVWRLVERLWPALRAQFACCTLAYQPRSLDDRPFDLMFAPGNLYSRFHSLPSHHVLDEAEGGNESHRSVKHDAWLTRWAGYIFSPLESELSMSTNWGNLAAAVSDHIATGASVSANTQVVLDNQELTTLLCGLSSDPTDIRRLFLLSELLGRISQTSLAGVGAMDVLASLAPEGTQALSVKHRLVNAIVTATDQLARSEEVLHHLWLVSERLDKPPFARVGADIGPAIIQTAAARTVAAPEAALTFCARLLLRHRSTLSPLTVGILRGLAQVADQSPAALTLLEEHEDVAPAIIAAVPQVALAYLRHSSRQTVTDQQGRVAAWVASLSNDNARVGVVNALLPEIKNDANVRLATELLRDITPDAVHEVLNKLVVSTQGFVTPKLRTLIAEQVAHVHPHDTRLWSMSISTWMDGVAEVVAATFDQSRDGLNDLLSFTGWPKEVQGRVIAAFLQLVAAWRLPIWLRDDPGLRGQSLRYLIKSGTDFPGQVQEAIYRLVEDLAEVPVDLLETLWPAIHEDRSGQTWEAVRALAARSVARHYLAGTLDEHDRAAWATSLGAARWTARVSAREIQHLLTGEQWRDAASRERAWTWLVRAPATLYQRTGTVLEDIVSALLSPVKAMNTRKLAVLWVKILQRATNDGHTETRVRLCAQALRFALDHKEAPLGAVVAESFFDVYQTVVDTWDVRGEVGRWFGFFDWDKGKALRQELVDAFMTSSWAPGDLGLSVPDVGLLRKIVKRVLRKAGGTQYLEAMLTDLRRRDDARARSCARTLAELLGQPDYSEEWD